MWISYLSWRWRSVTKCGRHNFLSDFTFQLLKNASIWLTFCLFLSESYLPIPIIVKTWKSNPCDKPSILLSNRNLVLVLSLKRTRSIWFHVTTWSENLNNCHFCIGQIDNGRSKTKLYDKRIDFIFPIVNFPFISSNIPTSPAYGIYISQLICYSRVCAQYSDILDRAQLLTQWLLITRLRCS
jgi:hypothetical protein